MAFVAPPRFRHHHHQPPAIFKTPPNCRLFLSTFHPRSLSFSSPAKTLQSNSSSSLSVISNPTPHVSPIQHIHHLCNSGSLTEALTLLQNHCNDANLDPLLKKEAINAVLQACGHHKDIHTGRKVHEILSLLTQFRNDFVLHTRLITMYSSCGYPLDSRSVFDHLQRKNLFVWNALISGYTRNELYDKAIRTFIELISETEFQPDNFTLPCVVKACAGNFDFCLGRSIHGIAVKLDLMMTDVFVGNSLISMYGKCGLIEDAFKLFDLMPERNLVSWNSMICGFSENGFSQQCYDLLKTILQGELSFKPDVATLVTLLPVCAEERNLDLGVLIHGMAVKLGLSEELMVNNALTDMYSKCGYLTEAVILFDKNDNKNAVSWNSMIAAYSREGDICRTFDLLRKMQIIEDDNLMIDDVTILNVLPTCLEDSELVNLKELHGYSIRHGLLLSDELIKNAFVAAYSKCGSLDSAQHVFSSIKNKTVSSWNALIGGHAQNGNPRKALDFYLEMKNSGIDPDLFSLSSLLLACSHLKFLHSGEEVHGFVVRNGLEMDSFIAISLLSLYIQCGNLSSARILFDKTGDKNLVSWNAMVSGYSQNRLPDEAIDLFRRMLSDGFKPYEIATMSVLGACSQLSALRLGRELHCFALKARLTDDIFVNCSLMDMYAKSGCIEQSQRVFDGLKEKDVASWNVMIVGYGVNGHGNKAIELFEEMQKLHQKNPDCLTFVGILMACSHAGLVTDGLKYLNQMQCLYKVEAQLEHYACAVDMLGRAGRFDKALEIIEEMPEEPDAGIWSSLLSSSRTYGDLNVGLKAAERLLELEPNKADNYVLLSNLYAISENWDQVRRVRQRMKNTGLYKEAGTSWIEIKGIVHRFVAGDNLLPESEEIREMWERLEEKISEMGYKPNVSCVLHELEEEEKKQVLRRHSEKLAISFGLLKTSKGTTLRVCKNLRICLDCHDAAKFISKSLERDIVVRDNKRFHHFRNGFCSCGDYW